MNPKALGIPIIPGFLMPKDYILLEKCNEVQGNHQVVP